MKVHSQFHKGSLTMLHLNPTPLVLESRARKESA